MADTTLFPETFLQKFCPNICNYLALNAVFFFNFFPIISQWKIYIAITTKLKSQSSFKTTDKVQAKSAQWIQRRYRLKLLMSDDDDRRRRRTTAYPTRSCEAFCSGVLKSMNFSLSYWIPVYYAMILWKSVNELMRLTLRHCIV